MKKFISIALILTTLLTFSSCGETATCEFCEKEVYEFQIREREWDGFTYNLCNVCDSLMDDYESGKAIECDSCGDIVRKNDAHSIFFWGEYLYFCDECYEREMQD